MDTRNRVGLGGGAAALLVAAAMAPSAAYAQAAAEPPAAAPVASEPSPAPHGGFGARGQWIVMSTSNAASLYSETFSGSEAHFVDANIGIGVDAFVARNFSLGIDAEASYGDNKGYGSASLRETTSTHFAGGVRFGTNVPLGRVLSLFPRVSIGINVDHSSSQTISVAGPSVTPAPPTSTSNVGPWVNLYAPLLVHPVPHFFVGIGPRLLHSFSSLHGGPYDGSQTTQLSAETVVGGWWGGADEAAPPPDEAPPPRHTFGEKGQLVLTAATTGSIASNTYSNSSASSTGVDLEPGFDYFVLDQVSLGVDSFASYSAGKFFDASGAQTHTSSSSFGVGIRPGVVLPLVRGLLSLWVQGEVGYGVVQSKQDSAAGSNDHDRNRSWVRVQAPLLVQATEHLFLGAGPYVFTELSDTDQFHYENDATSLGASFMLGGWL